MKRTYVKEVSGLSGQPVLLYGWVYKIRSHSKVKFLLLRDVTGVIQCVASPESPEVFELLGKLSPESVVAAAGIAVSEPQAPGGIEIHLTNITIISEPVGELPIPVYEKGNEADQSLRLDYRWLDLRKPEKLLIFKVWRRLEAAFREYWLNRDFLEIHSPKLMAAASESGADLFEVKYFDRSAYLAQSPQFYKQMAMAAGFEKVFEIGPIFRAEPSFTPRHATEFTGYDFEISFIQSHQDVISELESTIVYAIAAVQRAHGDEIESLYRRKLVVPTLPFPQIALREAKERLRAAEVPSERTNDLGPEEEKALCRIILDERGHEFVFVTDYPPANRAFYHMRSEDDPNLTKGFDLLWNGVEITTGAQREHRYDVLRSQATERGLTKEFIGHYLSFFQFGCPPHGGAGIGPTRMMMKIFDTKDIREVTYLHRSVNRLTP